MNDKASDATSVATVVSGAHRAPEDRPLRFWRRVSLRRQILLVFAVPIVIVFLASLFLLRELDTLDRSAHASVTSTEAIGLRYALLNSVVDAETGVRGYLLAGDPEFLQPYTSGWQNFDRISQQLEQEDAGNAAELRNLHQVQALFHRWRQDFAEPQIASRKLAAVGDAGEARIMAAVASKRGKNLIDAIRDLMQTSLRDDVAEQHSALTLSATNAGRVRWVALLAPVCALAIGLILVLLLLLDAIRAIDATDRAATAVASGDLHKRMKVIRRDELGRLGNTFNHMAEELADRHRRSSAIDRFQTLLVTSNSMEEIYAVVARVCAELFLPGASGAIYRIAPSRNVAERVAQWSWPDAANGRVLLPEDCRALRSGKPYLAGGNTIETPCRHTEQLGISVARSMCLPLSAHGEMFGVLQLCRFGDNVQGNASARDIETAILISEQLSLSLANMLLREQLRNQSIRDPLTGLFNRRYLEETMERELARTARNGLPLAVIALDVDHFKHFNDMYGHEAGDKVLVELAGVLRRGIRNTDIACRYGGEEFVLLMPESPVAIAVERIEALRRQTGELRIRIGDIPLEAITLSGGIAIAPLHGESGEVLLRNADTALYEAKAAGRDRVIVYRAS